MGTLRAMIVTFIRQFARALTLVAVALLILLKSVELTAIAGGVAFDTSASAVQVALWVAVCAIVVWLALECVGHWGAFTRFRHVGRFGTRGRIGPFVRLKSSDITAADSQPPSEGERSTWSSRALAAACLALSALYAASLVVVVLVALDEKRVHSFEVSDYALPSPLPVFEAIAFVLLALAAASVALQLRPLVANAKRTPAQWMRLKPRLYGAVSLAYAAPLIVLGSGTRHWSMPAVGAAVALRGSVLVSCLRARESHNNPGQ